jgi:TonB family protein
MKASQLAVLLSLGSLLPFASHAKTPEQAYLESCLKSSNVPVPVAVVSPRVSPDYIGDTVELEFAVDAAGQAFDFSVKSSPDDSLSTAVIAAVKQWQFKPALRDGVPVTTRVVLPVHIVDGDRLESSYAAN